MRGDNVEYVPRWVWDKDTTWTAADPLHVPEPSWQIAAAASDHGGAPAMLGLVMLSLAFAAGVVVGWVVR